MDHITLMLAVLTLGMAGVTWQARRLGNERRDVRLLGAFTGLLGAGTAFSAL
jgi:hypothetical protein